MAKLICIAALLVGLVGGGCSDADPSPGRESAFCDVARSRVGSFAADATVLERVAGLEALRADAPDDLASELRLLVDVNEAVAEAVTTDPTRAIGLAAGAADEARRVTTYLTDVCEVPAVKVL